MLHVQEKLQFWLDCHDCKHMAWYLQFLPCWVIWKRKSFNRASLTSCHASLFVAFSQKFHHSLHYLPSFLQMFLLQKAFVMEAHGANSFKHWRSKKMFGIQGLTLLTWKHMPFWLMELIVVFLNKKTKIPSWQASMVTQIQQWCPWVFELNCVWINGPFWGGKHDMTIFKEDGLKDKLKPHKNVIVDRGCSDFKVKNVFCQSGSDLEKLDCFKVRASLCCKTFNGRLKNCYLESNFLT